MNGPAKFVSGGHRCRFARIPPLSAVGGKSPGEPGRYVASCKILTNRPPGRSDWQRLARRPAEISK